MSGAATAPAIELRVHDIGQLFQSLDPLPYRERDLDERVEEYVVGWAGEMARAPSEIIVHLPKEQCAREEAAHIGDAIHHYFMYRTRVLGWELGELFRVGRTSLAVGLTVLLGSVVLARALGEVLGSSDLGRMFEEGLIILGWVANWRPIQIFLYDWQPLARKQRLYRRLATTTVRLAPLG